MIDDNEQRKIWDLDEETLKKAWKAYYSRPAIERDGFGKWFLKTYYIPGIVAWPSLENEEDDDRAYAMLHEFCCDR